LTVVAAWHLVSVGKLRVFPAAAMAVVYLLMAGTVVLWPDTRTSSILPIIVESAPTIVGSSAVSALVVSVPAEAPIPLPPATQAAAGPTVSSSVPASAAAPALQFSESANIRLALWRGAWAAFEDSPIIGHGWARMMDVVEPYLAPDERSYAELPQLHNDIIDFAVAAGVIGVGLYFLILFTPLIGAWRLPRDSQHAARTYGVVVLTTAYACDGLTDLMFGFEFHTAFFVVISVILLGYCRDDPWSPAGRTRA
jgi:O-antigen ligase